MVQFSQTLKRMAAINTPLECKTVPVAVIP